MEDEQIIGLYWSRSERAIAETANKYGGCCRAIAYNILHDDRDAEECLNDTYLRAWGAMPTQRPNCLAAFLGRITRNLSLDRYQRSAAKKRGRGQTILALEELAGCVPGEDSVEGAFDERALVESLEQFLLALPRLKREVFIRRYWYLSSIRDIAGDYGMSESKTASMLHRTRIQLKAHLKEEGVL